MDIMPCKMDNWPNIAKNDCGILSEWHCIIYAYTTPSSISSIYLHNLDLFQYKPPMYINPHHA